MGARGAYGLPLEATGSNKRRMKPGGYGYLKNSSKVLYIPADKRYIQHEGSTKMKIMIVNSTKADLRPFHLQIVEAIKTGKMPDELADMFSLTVLIEGDTTKGIITWA